MRPENLPLELSYQRSIRGMTQVQLAKDLGVSDRSIKMWESGDSLPRKAVRIKMAQLFGLHLTHFFLDDELPSETAPRPTPELKEIDTQQFFNSLSATLLNPDISDDSKMALLRDINSNIEQFREK